MEIVLIVAGLMLAVAAALTLIRIVRGPGPADRVVATDVLIAVVAGSLVVEAAINRHSYTIPVVLVLSLLAFAGTVAVARFVAAREGVVGSGPDDVDGLEGDAPGKDPDAPSAAEVDEQEDRP
ncbi:monovalent cation/H+ antiporter complex subunit F [Agrococcus sp. DT81.2]|uniref:monovalent cation/H+ antiporter complex subunit F n=1 Tax=Agrococcus sp. DT81.2 TaxID=3393414 RepID=UPI003CE5862B